MNTPIKTIILALALTILTTSVLAESVFSGYVKEFEEFTADGIIFKVIPTGEDTSAALKSSLGTTVVYLDNESCQFMSKYELCFTDYKFALGNKTRMNGKDPEQYLFEVNKLFEDAKITVTRTADKTVLFVDEHAKVTTKIKNIGGAVATEMKFFETFPTQAYVTSQYPVTYRRLEWSGALAQGKDIKFSYDVYFNGNGTHTIPLSLSYFDGLATKKISEELKFTVSNEYDVLISSKNPVEPYEQVNITVQLSGNPKGLLHVEFVLPQDLVLLNTTFERHFGVNSWEGNVSGSVKNFTTSVYTEKSGEKEVYLDAIYVGSLEHSIFPLKINFTHKKPELDYVMKNGKISIFVKNDNNHTLIKDMELIISGAYTKKARINEIKPRQEIFVLSEQIDPADALKDVNMYATYYIGEDKYKVSNHEGIDEPVASAEISNATNNASEQPAVTQPTNQADNPANQTINDVDNTSAEPTINQEINPEQAVAQEPIKEEAKKDTRGTIQKFFDWLGSLFG